MIRNERHWKQALAITGVATLVRLILGAILPLFPDETYYWDWTRHLAGGYFDHPPAIAFLIAGGVRLASFAGMDASPFIIRFFPVLAGGCAGLFTALITRSIGGDTAARRAALLIAVMPLAASGLVLATPDAPLLGTSAAALYCVVRALRERNGTSMSTWWYCGAGVALGLSFSSKYTSILLPVMVSAAILVRSSLRARLAQPGPWLACIVATLVFAPVLLWNASHHWVSFLFQIQHGLGTPSGSPFKRELDLFGGQVGLVSPILFVLAGIALWRTLRSRPDDVRFTLATVAVGSWVFFIYSALRRSVEANWPAPAYIPAIALLAVLADDVRIHRWVGRGVALAIVMVCVIYLHAIVPVLPLPAKRDPIARSAGWKELGATVQHVRDSLGLQTHVAADRYQDVSELAYQLSGRPQTFCTCLGGRRNQYELWPAFPDVAREGDHIILVLEDTSLTAGSPAKLARHFEHSAPGQIVPLLRGRDTVSVRRLWILSGYRGGWEHRTE